LVTATHASSLYVSNIRLAALPTAASCSRTFVHRTLRYWHMAHVIDTAELVASELVTNAVRATGAADLNLKAEHVIGVQVRILGVNLYVEVWDNNPAAPVRRESTDDDEHGRGLLLVNVLANRWGVFRPRDGGKVVWAEVALATPGKPVDASPPPQGAWADRASAAMLERLLSALQAG
jgi:anti-sigma regulatory factor (Ser/Thr protein kinase)